MEGEQNVPRWFRYVVPWTGRSITPNSVDLLLSTDAMEHVDDVAGAIRAMRSFVKPDGWVSHIINFTSEGTTEAWNGHWGYGDLRWKLLRGRRLWQLNRLWLSAYLSAFEERGFALRHVARTYYEGPEKALARHALKPRFRGIPEEDLHTSRAHIMASVGPS